jgi:hypothetical protein
MKIVSNLFWRRSGTEGFLGRQSAARGQVALASRALILMGAWCGSVPRARHRQNENQGA